jgi:hypothetical protein
MPIEPPLLSVVQSEVRAMEHIETDRCHAVGDVDLDVVGYYHHMPIEPVVVIVLHAMSRQLDSVHTSHLVLEQRYYCVVVAAAAGICDSQQQTDRCHTALSL